MALQFFFQAADNHSLSFDGQRGTTDTVGMDWGQDAED